MTRVRPRGFAFPAIMAIAQLALPVAAHAGGVSVAICGQTTRSAVPIRIPARNDAPCAKLCHGAMRKRSGGDIGGEQEEETDAA